MKTVEKFLLLIVLLPLLYVVLQQLDGQRLDWLGAGQEASTPEADAIANAFRNQASGVQVADVGVVDRVLPDDKTGSRHQRFIVRLASNQTLLIAHNIDLAPRIPFLKRGDTVAFCGVYEWNSKGGTVHWTHHDPLQKHQPGWLKHNGEKYR